MSFLYFKMQILDSSNCLDQRTLSREIIEIVFSNQNVFMSPVSPVFHTEVTVSIGLKNELSENIHSIILDVYVGWQSAHL